MIRTFCRVLLFTTVALSPLVCHAQPRGRQAAEALDAGPDTIFFHGSILTGAHLRSDDTSPSPARVSAIAVRQGRILAIGSDGEMLARKTRRTAVVDLRGAFAMPGFNDAHVHLFSAGSQKFLSVDLDGTRSLAEMQHRIKIYGESVRPGSWIVGSGWDHTAWASKTLPTRQDIDAVTVGHPAAFYRTDGHILVVNSAGLAAAGITSATPDPFGGKIDHDATGAPTGIVRETPATSLIDRTIPPPNREDRRAALLGAMNDAVAHGVTSVQDYSPEWDNFTLMEELERTGELPLRVAEWIDFTLPLATLEQRRASHPADDPWLHLTQLKGFMDGSLGSRTAALAAPYTDDPANSGLARFSGQELNRMSAERAAAGFQLGFHAIGDQANALALDAFAFAEPRAQPANRFPSGVQHAESPARARPLDPRSLRFRIEHAQVLLPADFDRFAALGVIASMQPSHLLTDMNWATQRLGETRVKYAYAWRSMLDHHVVLAFGTDYPVESIDPLRGLYAAITRQNTAGTLSFHPEQRISIEEAIYAYTQASAFAEFRETLKGRLEPGFVADFVVFDRDLTSISPAELLKARVVRTVIDGRTVYSKPISASPSQP